MEPFGFQDSHSFRCQIWNQFNLIGSKSKKRKVKIDYDQKRFWSNEIIFSNNV